MPTTIEIRPAKPADLSALVQLRLKPEENYFARCFLEQEEGKRDIFIACKNAALAGYVQLVWSPAYAPFRKFDIPEIEDLYVDPDLRQAGIGSALIDYCEAVARKKEKKEIGLGVGLYSAFGPAQRLYIKKGYIPDGGGAVYEATPVAGGEIRPMDDFLCLKLIKKLGSA